MNDSKTVGVLKKNADNIYQLILRQKEHLCLAQCPAFEEVIDTQLFGLSKQLDFAVQIGKIDEDKSHEILNHLEKALNEVYQESHEIIKKEKLNETTKTTD
ncbi:MAG TPA: DUF1507 domain-containing protein [Bavariicoccus seileri]|uniref:DUF1507 domain-containing protein n=1 Tax=Bavariicoccus seileri TaxID=549685 RepID=A0A3D4S3R3_9ENTE|nr:DUF1507 family protein [Bavariicoccus seileri]HCS93474.1 DUF1507 domain-containing protein [Bavariicoccus seileri]